MHDWLLDTVVLFGASLVILGLCYRMRISPVVGLLLTGALIGPHGLAWVREAENVERFAELGVVLLLFVIGLELSLDRLRAFGSNFLLAGPLQVLLTVGAVTVLAAFTPFSVQQALYFGMVVSLSSTALVLKLLAESKQTESPHGQLALSILLFQDLLIAPMLLLVPWLAGGGDRSGGPGGAVLRLGIGLLVVSAAFLLSRYLVPRLFRMVAATSIREMFLLAALFTCLGGALATESLGFSLALGAVRAGVVLAESDQSHQVLADIAPFRDLFTSIFFISIGMLLDLRAVVDQLVLVALVALGILLVKALLIAIIVRGLGFPRRTAGIAGLSLAQIGEFSFVLLQAGLAVEILTANQYNVLLAGAFLTLLVTPVLISLGPRLPWPAADPRGRADTGRERRSGHVVIVGFGLTGRHLARVLRAAGQRYQIIEIDGRLVAAAQRDGEPILFGDAARPEILEHAGVAEAAMVVFAISDPAALRQGLRSTRAQSPRVPILVRTHRLRELDELKRHGADEVISEEFETSIELLTRVLTRLHVPRNVIRTQARLLREGTYEMLRAEAPSTAADRVLSRALAAGTTDVFLVDEAHAIAGRTLRDLELRRTTGASVIAFVRDDQPDTQVDPDSTIRPGDALVLVGSHQGIEKAFRALEGGAEEQPVGAGDRLAAPS
ncbi:MAG TPA: cation:proton antiporter [Thermoanaerobaculia bacterium]|nr:cation:proton antiporter [Thermoanaerobaculia bacterium]